MSRCHVSPRCLISRAVAVLLAAVLAACGRERGPVNIGVVFGQAAPPTARLAADEINAAGGIRGRPVVIVADTISDLTEPADLEIRRARGIMAREKLVGVVGHSGSRGSLAAAPVYNEARVVQLVPTSTSERVLFLSGDVAELGRLEADEVPADRVLIKPMKLADLERALLRVVEH